MDVAPEVLVRQAQNFSVFTGATKLRPADRIFLVMGLTGAGKSTFVGRCTGNDVVVGHGLHSCTKSIGVFDFELEGRRVYLVDTPGFNDTDRSDTETLSILARHLGASYANGARVHGIILLHPISNNRMSGSGIRSIEMIKAMCAFSSYANLAIATTMWPESPDPAETRLLVAREADLLEQQKYFGCLVSQGATLLRHSEKGCRDPSVEAASAKRIVAHLLRQSDMHTADVLRLQREIVDEEKTIGETLAGIAISRELYEVRQEHERQLQKLKEAMEEPLAKSDAAHAEQLRELRVEVETKLKKADGRKESLKMTMKDLHMDERRFWKEKITSLDTHFRKHLAAQEEELREMEESQQRLRKERDRRATRESERIQNIKRKSKEQQAEVKDLETPPSEPPRPRGRRAIRRPRLSPTDRVIEEDQEKIVREVRDKVTQTRKAYQLFQAHTGSIMDGAVNGIAAGAATGLIALATGGLVCVVM
ncbi:hypothetical protein AK830_g255 [Neonectria ditissima]|uniref:G domain-containing protein n=1 Tax=Neonectria ditissima TaxID=78410 RepID=A0A0P7BLJ6_9HYPO|nr:hypothetical protein AK830_g255 [Neonectria ditissima]